MSRRVSFDSPRLQRIESKVVSSKNPFDLCVKFPRYFESIAVPIGSKIGGHPVIRDTHTIWTLLNEDGHRRIRASVNNMLHHFLHDQRIARNDAENSWLDGPILFLENLTVVEPRKLHKPARLSHRIHYFFHFGFVLRRWIQKDYGTVPEPVVRAAPTRSNRWPGRFLYRRCRLQLASLTPFHLPKHSVHCLASNRSARKIRCTNSRSQAQKRRDEAQPCQR